MGDVDVHGPLGPRSSKRIRLSSRSSRAHGLGHAGGHGSKGGPDDPKRSSGHNPKVNVVAVRQTRSPESLLDVCAKIVAEHISFQRIEERYDRIPEPVQERIVFWAFPRNERDICMYSSMSRIPASSEEFVNSPFYRGIKLLEFGCVKEVLQVGFHLSGEIGPPATQCSLAPGYATFIEMDKTYKVSLSFDRCKITSVTCSCNTKDIFWCQHVVALVLYRIRYPNTVRLRVPISETLLQMNREQLQKFVQYLISEHHTEVLPTAQKLADEILQKRSQINQIAGAPDPTAGSNAEDDNSWHLDESQVRDQVKNYLSQGGYYNSNKQIASMFAKVREMLRVRDSNGSRMLTLITDQFLADPRLVLWKSQGTPMTDKCRLLWDQLGSLWVSVVLNPSCDKYDRARWKERLESWSKMDICPLEDPDFHVDMNAMQTTDNSFNTNSSRREEEVDPDKSSHEPSRLRKKRPILGPDPSAPVETGRRGPRTVFHKALDALLMTWDDPHLRNILKSRFSTMKVKTHGLASEPSTSGSISKHGQLWQEHIPTACARVEALRTHGYSSEALRLAVAIVRTMKFNQSVAHHHWKKQEHSIELQCTASGVAKKPGYASWEGWIGHSLNPIGCLFETLSEASLSYHMAHRQPVSELLHNMEESGSPLTCIRYRQIPVEDSPTNDETYLTLALEATLIGLGHQRVMPPGLYAQEKACKQEERLLARLQDLEWEPLLGSVLRRQANLLLDMGPSSGLGIGIHPESIPMQTFAKFLFMALLPFDADLAFKVGLRAMRMPILEEWESKATEAAIAAAAGGGQGQAEGEFGILNVAANPSSFVLSRIPRWYTLGHIEAQQCTLASTMLNAAKGNAAKLHLVLEAGQRHIHSPSHLFKLAQDAFRYGIPQDGPRISTLIGVALKLGLQVMRLTLTSLNWRRREMVRWIVTCASELGYQALITLMRTWSNLFTPTEAVGSVATTIMSPTTIMRLGIDFNQQEELAAAARTLALHCSREDPANCALSALTLCENEPIAFETAYQIVIDAAAQVMNSSQLFTVSRYMEHRGYPHRAHKLALLAMKNVQLNHNQENHPVINDVHWACALSHTLGKNELSAIVPLVIKNVQSATVLSDILRRCCISPAGRLDAKISSAATLNSTLPCDQPPLRQLLEAAMAAYVTTTHSRLSSISPRHYTEFIDFLIKARDTFMLAHDGAMQFGQLVENMKFAYKGKKKLVCLIKERFG